MCSMVHTQDIVTNPLAMGVLNEIVYTYIVLLTCSDKMGVRILVGQVDIPRMHVIGGCS